MPPAPAEPPLPDPKGVLNPHTLPAVPTDEAEPNASAIALYAALIPLRPVMAWGVED